ncbi:MAG: hypothetical protein LBM97_01015 [Candidatus Nomurabacteria bacterium]|jgi:hypothetical protein|nr:hypothetical protein [Candidatus Nomurabacteria bacterium]
MNKFFGKLTGEKGTRNLIVLGALAILFAVLLTAISIMVYQKGGAIQLDLSRPGYEPEKSVSDEAAKDFSSSGGLDDNTYDEFLIIWDEQTKPIKGDVFRASPLGNESLGLE